MFIKKDNMNFLELVKNRYSCRAYKSLSVEREKLDYILECVRFAPSAVNKQPWRFHIVSEESDKARLKQCYDRDRFKTAPMYVIASILHDEEWVRADTHYRALRGEPDPPRVGSTLL